MKVSRDTQIGKDDLYWWQPPPRFGIVPRPANLGDALSLAIVRACLETKFGAGRYKASRRLLALGSVLHHARDDDVVWGTGFQGSKPNSSYTFRDLDVRAVRGPLTQQLLRGLGVSTPDVFGDPGSLFSLIFPMERPKDVRGPLLIPHYSAGRRRFPGKRVAYTIGDDFRSFGAEIVKSSVVLSASLHGIIIAESYGVPAVFVHQSAGETLHKYKDYYESSGRSSFPIASSFEEAGDLEPPPLPEISGIQRGLLESFPYDLWSIAR